MNFEVLLSKIKSYNPTADSTLIRDAYHFAESAHTEQYRVSGDPYIEHPLGVASILAELELDVITIVGGLLHDVVEDTQITLEEIEARFGKRVALIVNGVTKLSRIEYKSKEEQQVENLRKMFFAMAEDIRVILIKLADRLHNMRTLRYLPAERQKEIAAETLDVFAPLAHRLGISRIKAELEDTALRYLEPEKYYELVDKVAKKRVERDNYIKDAIELLQVKLEEVGLECEIQGRAKHFYSIYKKMQEQQKDFSEIYDLIAIRVIVNTVKDCYGALGIIHTLWKPIPGRFKDYIAMPKINMYQSLHTTVMGPEGEPLEIQIRTWEMHRTAEYGIAAHWRYKEDSGDKEFDEKLFWLRQLLEWQHELQDAREFMETLKLDLFTDEVFVFTPKGEVIDLPAGSVPIDFAYRIHTDVGNRCIGAKVNGRIVPLDYQLCNGDIVEVLTNRQSGGPSRDWLKLVKTPQAKSKIRQWFKKEKRQENIAKGRETIEKRS
jgi:guanosine-3',5'-bis(diphosphate) 3'-pyrophosphohydrolase